MVIVLTIVSLLYTVLIIRSLKTQPINNYGDAVCAFVCCAFVVLFWEMTISMQRWH